MFTLDGIGRLGENLRLFLHIPVYSAFIGPNCAFIELNACGVRGVELGPCLMGGPPGAGLVGIVYQRHTNGLTIRATICMKPKHLICRKSR